MPEENATRKRRRYGALAAGLVGLCVGGLAGGLLAPVAVQGRTAAGVEEDRLVEILVARRTVPAGTELGYAVLMRAPMPARFVSGSMARPEHVGHLVGERVIATIREGDPVLWSHLAAGAPEAICDWVREGNRPRHGE